jgi:murein DD-endopeptidase MepM/ murein hydrolase activator NlpD
MLRILLPLITAVASFAGARGIAQDPAPGKPPAARTEFVFPCDGYLSGLRGKGNFGVLITQTGSPFAGSYHLAEDVWLRGGTKVRAVADGVVRYSDFSPTWTDARGHVHWNLGNVIVIEHRLVPAEDGLEMVCSFYVHLGADRRVTTGAVVERGQIVGTIGADKSEENGRYPAHLHFGLHRGPYFQVPPSWRSELVERARTTGIELAPGRVLRGALAVVQHGEDSVLLRVGSGKEVEVLSLRVGSTAPGDKPADIMCWCKGYGERAAVDEWLRPSSWIAAHGGAAKPTSRPTSRPQQDEPGRTRR